MNTQAHFRKWSLKLLKVFGLLFGILFVFYIGLGFYLSSKQEKILSEVNLFTKQNFKGAIAIGDLNVLIFKDFPALTIELKDVTVKDSLWYLHKKTLIDSDYLYAKIYPWKLLFGNLEINKVTLKNAVFTIHTEANGYSNTAALEKRKLVVKEQKESFLDLQIGTIDLKDVHLIADNQLKKKSINLKIKSLSSNFTTSSSGFTANAKLNAHIDDLTFNFKNGSFAKNKDFKGNLIITFDEEKKNISIDSDAIQIGNCQFNLHANFGIKGNSLFSIGLMSNSVYWKDAASLVSNNIFSKLNKFDLKKPFPVECTINGDLKNKDFLKIHVVAQFKDNELTAVDRTFTNCSFTGEYTNNYADNGTYDDYNSAVMLHDFKASFEGIPFVTKDLMVVNLKKPIASGSVESDFDAQKLNAFFTEDYMRFDKGNVRFSISFKSDVVDLKIAKPFIKGFVAIKDCDFTFVPKMVTYKKNSIDLEFTSDELIVRNFSFETQNSKVQMKGNSNDFMSLYYDSPQKIVLNWEVYSPYLDLKDFTYFLSPSKTKVTNQKKKTDIFDKLINTQSITAKVKIDKFTHKKFVGKNLIANVELNSKQIKLKELSVNSCGGSFRVSKCRN